MESKTHFSPSFTSSPHPNLPFGHEPPHYPIVVHSHLAWDWVWQRPQQFVSRLAQRHRILFVEGPTPSPDITQTEETLREIGDYPNVVVLQMRIPAGRWNDGAWVDHERRRIVQRILAEPLGREFDSPVQWF